MTKKQMTAEQMISFMKNMENGQRYEFLHYLNENHFKRGEPMENMTLAVRYRIEDDLDRDLTVEELSILKQAYDHGYSVGYDFGLIKGFKGVVGEEKLVKNEDGNRKMDG